VFHEFGAELTFGFILIVTPASQLSVLHGCSTSIRHTHDMVVLEKPAGRTSMSELAHESALSAISLPDHALDGIRHVPGVLARALASLPRSVRRGELALLEICPENFESPGEDGLEVARSDSSAKKILNALEVFLCVLANRDLN
jgi:hypothetical protein